MLNVIPARWMKDIDGTDVKVTNLTRRVAIRPEIKNNPNCYLTYEIGDGEDPRDIAQRYYGDSELFYLLFLMNDIHSLESKWPKRRADIIKDLEKSWVNPHELSHYEDPLGYKADIRGLKFLHGLESAKDSEIVERFSLKPVTFYEYAVKVNESKRTIKVLLEAYVQQVVDEIEEKLNA